MAAGESRVASASWLVGGGELGERIRALDWASTPLGPLDSWSPALRTAVGMMLSSRAQIIFFWGPEFVVLYNDAYRSVFGGKHPWALGLPGREAWSEIWDDQLGPLLRGVVETGEAFWATDLLFCIERNGYLEETYFDISYDPVRDATGAVAGVYCIVTETTARVSGERRLRTLGALGRIGLGTQTVAAVLERAAKVLGENPDDIAFALLYERDAASGAAQLRAHVGIDASHPAALDQVSSEGVRWPGSNLPPEGLVLEARSMIAARLPGGRWPEACEQVAILPIGISSPAAPDGFFVAGLSPRRLVDASYRDFLRLVAAGIASGLSNLRALEAERRRGEALTELDFAKTAFFSNVSHEFRTPLTLMLGPLNEEIANGRLPSGSRERLEMCYRNGIRLLKLVNSMLDFSRIEAGRMTARFEATDLAAFTAELASNFQSACEAAGLALRVSCETLDEPVFIDRDMWEKIVFNLLSNAFKFTFEGAIDVRVSQSGHGAVLEIRDSGVGIEAGTLPRIFERFRRVEGVRSRTHEGTGIGLAMVQELVRMQGGEIRVESEPDEGSVFTVSLPFGTSHLAPEQIIAKPHAEATARNAEAFVQEALDWLRASSPRKLPEVRPAETSRARILVAEDNADMREYVQRLLAEHWDVYAVPDGHAAVHALFTAPFDLVVTDVMMPRLDGFGLLKAIRSDPSLRDLPVVMLSARAGEEARSEGRNAGADDYLVKPFAARELVAQVRANLALASARRANARERETRLASEREAHLDLRRHWEDLARLMDQTPNPMMVLRGREHVIELANAAACDLWGCTAEEVLYKPLFDALPKIRRGGLETILNEVLSSGEVVRNHDAGFEFVYSPLRSPSGRIESIAMTAFENSGEAAVEVRQELRAAG
ncbi:MAG TPA: ATP-binding protein [Usitatibacter sp.]|nr:ATP-binding protein [Usitatibacter sp.]